MDHGLRWNTSTGPKVQKYYRYADKKAFCRANTLFDMLIYGRSLKEITQFPRRYVDYSGMERTPESKMTGASFRAGNWSSQRK